MRFYDKVDVVVKSGKGGDGAVSGRRELYIRYGGPSGGDGGKGGSVVFQASKDVNTLIDFVYKRELKAMPGEGGKSHDMYGKDAQDLIVQVPIGTLIKDSLTDRAIFQFLEDGEKYQIARGGRGGLGNIHFKTATRQYPNFGLGGEPGEYKEITLELQMLGDIALIGTPSVGKSTLINTISNVKAKVADYPFTTIVPNLGVVKRGDISFSVVDVPGLIKGASEGKGLGNEFLRHILKARIFVFMMDLSRYEEGMGEFTQLFDEIVSYIKTRFIGSNEYGKVIKKIDIDLRYENGNIILDVYGDFKTEKKLILRKMIYICLNKFDEIDDEEILQEYKKEFLNLVVKRLKLPKKHLLDNILAISAFTRYGLESFLDKMVLSLKNFQSLDIATFDIFDVENFVGSYIKDVTKTELKFLIDGEYLDKAQSKYLKVWEISDDDLSYYTFVLPWGNDEAEMRYWDTLNKKGIISKWESNGIQRGDIIKVKSKYEGVDDKYVMWD